MRGGRSLALAFVSAAFAASGQQPPSTSELSRAAEEFVLQSRNLGLRADSPRRSPERQKAGGRFHGRVFENFRNDFLDAVPHEVVQRGGEKRLLRRNQFGFNLTGPVIIPKLYHGGRTTFFSLTFEGVREKIGRTYLRTIPTLEERTGDWAHVVDQAGQPLPIYDPATTFTNPAFNPSQPITEDNLQYPRLPFPSNRMPASRLDPVAQAALQYYPAPNADAGPFFRNNYFILAPEMNRADGLISRVDHTLRERHRLGFGLNYSNGIDGAAQWFPTLANPGPVIRDTRNRRGTVEYVFTRSASSINTLTLDASTSQSVNQPELDQNGDPFPNYRFSPYLSMGHSYPVSKNARNSFTLTDGYSTRWREHRLRFVFQWGREQVNTFWPQYPMGSFRFTSGLTSLPGIVNTGHGFASFLLGLAEYAERSVVISPSYFRKSRYLLASRDQWELRKGLTLSVGLNLDMNTPRTERYDRQSTVSFALTNPVNGLPGALAAARRGGFGRAFQPFTAQLEPSASLAWNVRGNSKSVVRLSYGRSYSSIPIYTGQWGTQAFNGVPTWVSLNWQLTPAVLLKDGLATDRVFPDLRPEAANNTVADLIDPSGRLPTYQSFSFSYEREIPGATLVTAGAARSGGRNLLVSNYGANPNAIHPDSLAYRDRLNDELFNRSLRPFPHYQRFDVYNSWPIGRYRRDAAYLRAEKRTSGGLSLTAYYEFSKQMDDYSGPYGLQDYFNRRNEWSLTAYNNPHRFSLTSMYELPLGPNKALLPLTDWRRHLVAGWAVSLVSTIYSGEPLALRPQFNNTGGVLDTLNVNVVPGVEAKVPDPGPELWFNPAAFSHPADFTIGNASRTHPSILAPGSQNHDLSLTKRFSVAADKTVEFSAMGLNFVNHGVWTDPDTVIGTADAPNVNAGKIISSRGGRIIQLGLRFSF